MDYSAIFNYVLSGGLISSFFAIFTLKSKISKSTAEATKLHLDNSEQVADLLIANIVNPLKIELNETRTELSLLREAIHSARDCAFTDNCPVIHSLRHPAKTDECPALSKRTNYDIAN